MAESFFATLNREAVQGRVFATRPKVCMVIFDYIEVFYNRQRLHSSIAFAAPVTMVSLTNCYSTNLGVDPRMAETTARNLC